MLITHTGHLAGWPQWPPSRQDLGALLPRFPHGSSFSHHSGRPSSVLLSPMVGLLHCSLPSVSCAQPDLSWRQEGPGEKESRGSCYWLADTPQPLATTPDFCFGGLTMWELVGLTWHMWPCFKS